MISLARQLALRREIEEEMGELAGEAREVEYGECVALGFAIDGAPRPTSSRCKCVVCGVPIVGTRGRWLYCPAHPPRHRLGLCRKSAAAKAKRLAKLRAHTLARRGVRPCSDCPGTIEPERSMNAIRCANCARLAANAARRAAHRAAQQRRAA